MAKRRGGRIRPRRINVREPYNKVLIVCEGEKTEPNYFNGLIDYHGINTANVIVVGKGGSSPDAVVNLGKTLYDKSKNKGDAYDQVFLVFDKDSHTQYQTVLAQITSLNPTDTFIAINSVPCFEYWLLLHFVYSTAPYNSLGRKSSGAMALDDVLTHWPEYDKNRLNIFEELLPNLDSAIANAERSLNAAEAVNTDNPSTKVHKLVTYLQNIRSS